MKNVMRIFFERLQKAAVPMLCVVCVVMMAGSFSSCQPNSNTDIPNDDIDISNNDIDMSQIDFSNIENLYEQPLSVIQKCVQGKWKIYAQFGGFVGITYPENKFIEIEGNKLNDNEFQWKSCTHQISDNNFIKTYGIQFLPLEEPSFYFEGIKNDTLSVGQPNWLFGAIWVRIK